MIDEEARVEPIDDDNLKASTADGVGGMFDDSGDEATRTVQMDYSKPFRLFDEQGLGVIPVDKFRAMLYRLHVNSLLRERQVVALIDRFDVDRKGEQKYLRRVDFSGFGVGVGGRGGRTHFIACLSHFTIDRASLSRRSREGEGIRRVGKHPTSQGGIRGNDVVWRA